MSHTNSNQNLNPNDIQNNNKIRTQNYHTKRRVLIGPPLEYWFKHEAWTLKSHDVKSSVEDIARSTASVRSNTSFYDRSINEANMPNMDSVIIGSQNNRISSRSHESSLGSPTSAESNPTKSISSALNTNSYPIASTSNTDAQQISNIQYSPGPALPYANPSYHMASNTDLPKHTRALVRIEIAKEWNGNAGTYHSELLHSTERQFLPFTEYGLVLYHNRIELTKSISDVETIIPLDEYTQLSLYSSLDYTLAITREHKREHLASAYIIHFPTPEIAKSWYLHLHRIVQMVKLPSDKVVVSVPELDLKLEFLINSPDMTVWDIKNATIEAIKGESNSQKLLESWEKENSCGVCWKNLDRIEWVNPNQTLKESELILGPQFIEKTHELQIRTRVHSIFEAKEPYPTEGYLLFRGYYEVVNQDDNLITKKLDCGRLVKGKAYYVMTLDQHIGLVEASNFPKKSKSTILPLDSIPFTFIHSHERPQVEYNSFEKLIIDRNDLDLHSDLTTLKYWEGFIDFRQIKQIEAVTNLNNNSDPLFEVVLTGNRKLRFEAWNMEARSEWLTRLNQLLFYWKQRLQVELDGQLEILRRNALLMDENDYLDDLEDFETLNERVLPDTILWKSCLYQPCTSILKSGALYIKERQHTPFRKVHAILTVDGLHFFSHSVTSFFTEEGHDLQLDLSRLPPPLKFLHPREAPYFLSLKDCYVNTGIQLDLVAEGDTSEPHLYPDRILSNDTDLDRTFTLWESHISYLFPYHSNNSNSFFKALSYIYRNLACGHSLLYPWHWFNPYKYGEMHKRTFQCRSKRERDHWVAAINVAIGLRVKNDRWDK